MTAHQAFKIIESVTEKEAREMSRKIAKAEQKIQKRTQNPGKPFQEPVKTWHHRTRCSTCGGIHDGFKCPIGS